MRPGLKRGPRTRQPYGLTPMQARLLSILAHADDDAPIDRTTLMVRLYGMARSKDRDSKIVDVLLHHVRQAVVRNGVAIMTVNGKGWRLSGEDRAAVRAAFEAIAAEAPVRQAA